MTALSDLLSAAAKARGLTGRKIAQQAARLGHTLNHDTAARYLRGADGRPSEATLQAFAQVLDLDVSDLRRAADVPAGVAEPYQPPQESSRLSRRQRRAVDEIIRAMVDVPGSGVDAAAEPADYPTAAADERSSGTVRGLPRAARRGPVEPTQH
jgi:transcriptional regulator with XRE-family HTH domain